MQVQSSGGSSPAFMVDDNVVESWFNMPPSGDTPFRMVEDGFAMDTGTNDNTSTTNDDGHKRTVGYFHSRPAFANSRHLCANGKQRRKDDRKRDHANTGSGSAKRIRKRRKHRRREGVR